MNRRSFIGRITGAVAAIVCAPFVAKTLRFPRYSTGSSGSRRGGTAYWTPDNGAFIVPPHLVPALQEFEKRGGVIVGETFTVNYKPGLTIEEACRARGVRYT